MSELFQSVPQEHALGCAVACVASRSGLSYAKGLMLFAHCEHAWTRGYFCGEIVQALAKAGFKYVFRHFDPSKHARLIEQEGTIVFIGPCEKYPGGHYLMRTCQGWMNSWINFPEMIPVKSGFQKTLPGSVTHLVYEVHSA